MVTGQLVARRPRFEFTLSTLAPDSTLRSLVNDLKNPEECRHPGVGVA
ncbi:hypothetical protein LPU83_pLPU83d_0577 (plasmid) [Rhizobium favelukesii]|uniref:Uncharacterized protein n=1 Tax=Rhizobium favelukesii TaxID=348824 RepID=W6RT70_9HYPH|nr:hypothetical protein LPU83_pLPU83d_0577 [Rhizobium favelukesii]